ncbi:hypothetical protein TRAPUB_5495 [Trametes pubescens]|uniref:Uncharacterized protein n=1 Tax=Trametes pubescens TaxID=154538 RepID=A0A1M2W738_TRAPU|nr:hypothetical protein TRAPUB_5495 [Trametes pubescens]
MASQPHPFPLVDGLSHHRCASWGPPELAPEAVAYAPARPRAAPMVAQVCERPCLQWDSAYGAWSCQALWQGCAEYHARVRKLTYVVPAFAKTGRRFGISGVVHWWLHIEGVSAHSLGAVLPLCGTRMQGVVGLYRIIVHTLLLVDTNTVFAPFLGTLVREHRGSSVMRAKFQPQVVVGDTPIRAAAATALSPDSEVMFRARARNPPLATLTALHQLDRDELAAGSWDHRARARTRCDAEDSRRLFGNSVLRVWGRVGRRMWSCGRRAAARGCCLMTGLHHGPAHAKAIDELVFVFRPVVLVIRALVLEPARPNMCALSTN